jgi:glycosyltransferase involved in cell wall biosynthesis
VTVAIPTYNREKYLKEAIESVLAQSFQDFEIIIFDNHSNYDIKRLISSFGDSRISLNSNSENIGGAGNFQKVFNHKFSSDYVIVFHDDDTMHPELLQTEVDILEKDKNIVLVGTDLLFVADDNLMSEFKNLKVKKDTRIFRDAADLVRLILRDFDLCFDSVMYRADRLEDSAPYQERFFKWADRPLVITIAKKGECAIINEKLVNYRIHSGQDSQSSATSEQNYLFNLFKFYRDNLPQPLLKEDKRLFHYFSTSQVILSGLGFSNNFQEYCGFLRLSKKEGLFNFKYLNIRGLYYFFKVLKRFL